MPHRLGEAGTHPQMTQISQMIVIEHLRNLRHLRIMADYSTLAVK
jgi:hypothetical protein